jgi:hypothetical protein
VPEPYNARKWTAFLSMIERKLGQAHRACLDSKDNVHPEDVRKFANLCDYLSLVREIAEVLLQRNQARVDGPTIDTRHSDSDDDPDYVGA